METVSVRTEVEVNIYEVQDQNGNGLSFGADTDSDGDIVITVEVEEVDSVDRVRDYIADNGLFDELAEECCDSGTSLMIRAFLKHEPSNVVDAVSYHTERFLDALFESDDIDIKDLIKAITTRAEQDD